MNIALVPSAKYWAGANRPWYVGQGMVTDYLRGKGFANVQWHKRADALPTDIDPRASTTYSDDWDEWVSADYQGAIGSLSPPVDLPWYIVHLPSYQAAKPPVASTSASAVPSWVTSSQQAGAGALAAGQAASQAAFAASQAAAARKAALSSQATAPAASSAGRTSGGNNAGAVVFAAGTAVIVLGVVRAILGKRRGKR
jgi:hypothetical protein